MSTTNHLTIAWLAPHDDGGCPVTGYAVYRDDGTGNQIFTEVNIPNDPAIRNNPVLRQVSITNLPALSEGKIFQVKVTVFNREGSAQSPAFRIMNSGKPLTPSAPVELITSTESSI